MKNDQVTVVASGTSAKEVLEEARKKGLERPTLFKVPSQIIPYILQKEEVELKERA